jgi:hypothetical protein
MSYTGVSCAPRSNQLWAGFRLGNFTFSTSEVVGTQQVKDYASGNSRSEMSRKELHGVTLRGVHGHSSKVTPERSGFLQFRDNSLSVEVPRCISANRQPVQGKRTIGHSYDKKIFRRAQRSRNEITQRHPCSATEMAITGLPQRRPPWPDDLRLHPLRQVPPRASAPSQTVRAAYTGPGPAPG